MFPALFQLKKHLLGDGMELSGLPKARSFKLNEVVDCLHHPTELLAIVVCCSVIFEAVGTTEHHLELCFWHSRRAKEETTTLCSYYFYSARPH